MAKQYFLINKETHNAKGESTGLVNFIYESEGIHMKNGWYNEILCEVKPSKESRVMPNGRKAKVFTGPKGNWGRYTDGSAGQLEA